MCLGLLEQARSGRAGSGLHILWHKHRWLPDRIAWPLWMRLSERTAKLEILRLNGTSTAQVPAWRSDWLVLKHAATEQNSHKKQIQQRIQYMIGFALRVFLPVTAPPAGFRIIRIKIEFTLARSFIHLVARSCKIPFLPSSWTFSRIQGFATQSSYAVGEEVLFKVKTNSRSLISFWTCLSRTHFLPWKLLKGLKESHVCSKIPVHKFQRHGAEWVCLFFWFFMLFFRFKFSRMEPRTVSFRHLPPWLV